MKKRLLELDELVCKNNKCILYENKNKKYDINIFYIKDKNVKIKFEGSGLDYNFQYLPCYENCKKILNENRDIIYYEFNQFNIEILDDIKRICIELFLIDQKYFNKINNKNKKLNFGIDVNFKKIKNNFLKYDLINYNNIDIPNYKNGSYIFYQNEIELFQLYKIIRKCNKFFPQIYKKLINLCSKNFDEHCFDFICNNKYKYSLMVDRNHCNILLK